jgi:hypothetical protein
MKQRTKQHIHTKITSTMKQRFYHSAVLLFALQTLTLSFPSHARSAVFTESFAPGAFPPPGWTVSGDATLNWMASQSCSAFPAGAYGDGSFALFDGSAANQAGSWSALESPAVAVSPDGYLLHFTVLELLVDDNLIASGLQLYVDVYDGTQWQTVTGNVLTDIPWHNTARTPQRFLPLTVDLSAYTDNPQVRVRFRAVSDYGGFSLGLDNISLSSEPAALPDPVAEILGIQGGLWSACASPLHTGGASLQNVFPQEQVLYFAGLFYENTASWSLSGDHTAIREIDSYKTVGAGFNDGGAHTAVLTAAGSNGRQASDAFSSTLRLVEEGLSDYVWNVSASDDRQQLVLQTTGTNYHYIHGLSSSVKRIAETYSIPGNASVTIERVGLVVGRYAISAANRSKSVVIRIGRVLPGGAPGEALHTFTTPFSALFGTSGISGAPVEKIFTLPEAVSVQGPFYIEIDLSSIATVGSGDCLGLMGSAFRPYARTTAYALPAAGGEWMPLDELYGGANCSAAILAAVTYHTISCAAPLYPAATAGATSATLSWTENSGAASWEIEYAAAGFTPGTGTRRTVRSNPCTIDGLQSETQYAFYVRSLCAADAPGAWSAACVFTTGEEPAGCEVAVLPLRTGFETPVPCWSSAYSNPDPADAPGRSTEQAYGGSYSWRFSSYNTTSSLSDHDGDAWLVSPELPADREKNLSFYYKGGSEGETFRVGYSTADNDPASFTWIDEITDATADAWLPYDKPEVRFPQAARYIAIYYTSDFQYFLYVDDVEISEAIPTGAQRRQGTQSALWPSVTRGVLHAATAATAKLTVCSPAGQKLRVYDLRAGRQTLSLDLPEGVYLLSVASQTGVETFRISVHR